MSEQKEAISEAMAAVELAQEALENAKKVCFQCNSPAFVDVNAALNHLKTARSCTEQAEKKT